MQLSRRRYQFDILNAFKLLFWGKITSVESSSSPKRMLNLREVINSYLSGKSFTCKIDYGFRVVRRVTKNVPLCSVFDTLRWNVGYCQVPKAAGIQMMCYADDTLHIPSGTSLTRTQKLMEMAVAAISTMIRYLGLEVALTETKVLWHDGLPRTRNPPPTMHYLQGDSFKVKDLQYLCLNLDSSLNFQTHFTFARLDIDCYDIYRSRCPLGQCGPTVPYLAAITLCRHYPFPPIY